MTTDQPYRTPGRADPFGHKVPSVRLNQQLAQNIAIAADYPHASGCTGWPWDESITLVTFT